MLKVVKDVGMVVVVETTATSVVDGVTRAVLTGEEGEVSTEIIELNDPGKEIVDLEGEMTSVEDEVGVEVVVDDVSEVVDDVSEDVGDHRRLQSSLFRSHAGRFAAIDEAGSFTSTSFLEVPQADGRPVDQNRKRSSARSSVSHAASDMEVHDPSQPAEASEVAGRKRIAAELNKALAKIDTKCSNVQAEIEDIQFAQVSINTTA